MIYVASLNRQREPPFTEFGFQYNGSAMVSQSDFVSSRKNVEVGCIWTRRAFIGALRLPPNSPYISGAGSIRVEWTGAIGALSLIASQSGAPPLLQSNKHYWRNFKTLTEKLKLANIELTFTGYNFRHYPLAPDLGQV